MIDKINGNCVKVKLFKDNSFLIETPVLYNKIFFTPILDLTDAVVGESFIGICDKTTGKVFYIDFTGDVFDYDIPDCIGLIAYKEYLFCFSSSKIRKIRRNVVEERDYSPRKFIGVSLYNPFSFLILEQTDIPTVSFYSISELVNLTDLAPTTFISLYYPSKFFDYGNMFVYKGEIWVRGENGLVRLNLKVFGEAGIVFEIMEFYSSYKEFAGNEFDLWEFWRVYNNNVFVFRHEKTGRLMYLVDNNIYFGDFVSFIDREWFYDIRDSVLYKYRFSDDETQDFYNGAYFNMLFNFGETLRFTGFRYDVIKAPAGKINFNGISNYRGEEKSWSYNLDLDKKNFKVNIYGEAFSLVWHIPIATKMYLSLNPFIKVER